MLNTNPPHDSSICTFNPEQSKSQQQLFIKKEPINWKLNQLFNKFYISVKASKTKEPMHCWNSCSSNAASESTAHCKSFSVSGPRESHFHLVAN